MNIVKVCRGFLRRVSFLFFLPFVMLYYYAFGDRRLFKNQSPMVWFMLSFVWFIGYMILLLLLSIFVEFDLRLIYPIMLILLGAYILVESIAFMRNKGLFNRLEFSRWYVDNLGRGIVWKHMLGWDRAARFTERCIYYLDIPAMILGVVLILAGFYYLLH